jgi:hypothetical protein
MCPCQERYCFGCGKKALLIEPLMMCVTCVDDWYRLAPARLREREEIHVR